MPGKPVVPQAVIAEVARRIPRLVRIDSHMREVVRGATAALVLRALGQGLGFGFNVLLARLLGADGTGVYYLALTITSVATVVGRLGLDNALLRFTAANATLEDWAKVAGVYRKGMLIAVSASTVATVLVVGGAPLIAQGIFSEPTLSEPLRMMALSILPMSLLNLHAELLKGLKKTLAAVLVQSVGVSLVQLPLMAAVGASLGVTGAVAAYVGATFLVLLLGFTLWRQATPQLRGLRGHFDTRLLFMTSLPLFWVASMDLVMSMTDTTLLGVWADSEAVGIYGVAKRTALLTSFVLMAANTIVAPKFAELYAQGDHRALSALARNAAKLMILVATPILLAFVIAPTWVLGIFGPDFDAGAPVLVILALGQFVNVATGSVGYLLMMTGHEKLIRNNIIASAALNVALNVILIPKYSIIGAAVATAISVATMNLISTVLVYWKLSIVTIPIPGLAAVAKRGRWR
jgi:O-antigen/teichoic acid export membrane protein